MNISTNDDKLDCTNRVMNVHPKKCLEIRNVKIQNNSNEIEIISQNVPNNAPY